MNANVILPLATRTILTYSVPPSLPVVVGSRVIVEVVSRRYVGVVLSLEERSQEIATLKPIIDVLDKEPLLSASTLSWYQWIADYYLCHLSDVYVAATPAPLRTVWKRKSTYEKLIAGRTACPDVHLETNPVALTVVQQAVKDDIKRLWQEKKCVLLHGVTGSGKTEIYVSLIADALRNGGQALLLMPEIALTTHLTQRLKRAFGDLLAIYHSQLSDRARADLYVDVARSKSCVVVGVRSALLLPWADLRVIVVDEEHDSSYKQEEPAPRYHARDAAVALGSRMGVPVLLGSATPSVESYYNARRGKYGLTRLDVRHGGEGLPDIEIVDMRVEKKHKTLEGLFSMRLVEEMTATLSRGEQVILFQNRRGFAPYMQCQECGYTPHCDHCDVSLSVHKRQNVLTCHYCGTNYEIPAVCPKCGSKRIKPVGFGTERVEENLSKLFPQAKVVRLDTDSADSWRTIERILRDFEEHKVDILVGTQMIAKGLDMRDAHLVGILNADNLLSFPNFRSVERAFDLLLQVGGRVGRRETPGKVILQTFSPDSEVIEQVRQRDIQAMYDNELAERETFRFPPFVRVMDFYVKGTDYDACVHVAAYLASALRQAFDTVLGPDNPPVGRKGQHYLRKVSLKLKFGCDLAASKRQVKDLIEEAQRLPYAHGTRIMVDVDPD